MEDKKISDMAELLCRGAKMLSYYCPDCKVPLFKDGTRVFCPSCGRDVVIGEGGQKLSADLEDDKPSVKVISRGNPQATNQVKPDMVIKRAIDRLLKELDKEDDVGKIKEIIGIIHEATEVIEKLRSLH